MDLKSLLLIMLIFCLSLSNCTNNGNLFDKMKSFFSPLAQFDIITIVPVWVFHFEFSITNLTITIFSVVLLGFIFFYFFFAQKVLPINLQIIL